MHKQINLSDLYAWKVHETSYHVVVGKNSFSVVGFGIK